MKMYGKAWRYILATIGYLLAGPACALPSGQIWLPDATEIGKKCDLSLAAAKREIAQLERIPLSRTNKENVLHAWNQFDINLQNMGNPVYLLSEVSPHPEIRKAAEECVLKLSSFENELYQRPGLYERLRALKVDDLVDATTVQTLLEQFEDSGVNLPKDQRAEARRISDRLDKLRQDFSRNMRDNKTKLRFTAKELKGIPAEFLSQKQPDEQGHYLIGFDYPEIDAVMSYVESAAVRQRYYYDLSRRGTEQNLEILREVVKLRKELSALHGFPSYAHWTLRRKMVEKPEIVYSFLNEVASKVESVEKQELGMLNKEKSLHTGRKNSNIKRWDLSFYQQRLKKARYAVDPQVVRAQFPTEATVAWLLNVTSRLYGVEFRRNPKLPVWHPDVYGYDVFDLDKKKYLASFYLDLFPRDGKYKHAAAFGIRGVSTQANRTPISVLVTNFNRQGLDQNELETLFHEFGHVMHNVLSRTRYVMNSGTSVKRDFVEAPSQMYEEWARRPESLRLFNETCPDCKSIDLQLIKRMDAARQFGQGTKYARQRLFAAYDMALASERPGEPMQVWIDMESKTPLGHIAGTQFPGTFGHIVGGYAAGYYGYMWSEVLALDMLSTFGGNVMDTEIGKRYRRIVLENGGQAPPMQLVEELLGRKPSPEAFFKEITGQRGAQAPLLKKDSKK